jgi:hypothetical protein
MPTTGRYVRIRDTITIDDALLREIKDEAEATGLPENHPVYLIARKIVHGGVRTGRPYSLRGCAHPLVLVCDHYSSDGALLDTSGPDGANGTGGAAGKDGHSNTPSKRKAGGPGRHGGDGGTGGSAWSITLIARELQHANLQARGGDGGHGGDGGDGGDGSMITTPGPTGKPEYVLFRGGTGGGGGSGGNAGQGAAIAIKHVMGKVASPHAGGGIGGIGGKGGVGGRDGTRQDTPTGPRAPGGQKGNSGSHGAAGTITQTQLTPNAWSAYVDAFLPAQLRNAWADYRERTGEYLFRSCVAARPKDAWKRALAAEEFAAAVRLRSDSPRAKRLAGIWPMA